jgi:hypothetical protein
MFSFNELIGIPLLDKDRLSGCHPIKEESTAGSDEGLAMNLLENSAWRSRLYDHNELR